MIRICSLSLQGEKLLDQSVPMRATSPSATRIPSFQLTPNSPSEPPITHSVYRPKTVLNHHQICSTFLPTSTLHVCRSNPLQSLLYSPAHIRYAATLQAHLVPVSSISQPPKVCITDKDIDILLRQSCLASPGPMESPMCEEPTPRYSPPTP